jgi:hypothetical protein
VRHWSRLPAPKSMRVASLSVSKSCADRASAANEQRAAGRPAASAGTPRLRAALGARARARRSHARNSADRDRSRRTPEPAGDTPAVRKQTSETTPRPRAQGPRRFLDKRHEPRDTALAVRATTRRMKARSISPGFRYFGGGGLVAEVSSRGPNPAQDSGFQPRSAPESRGSGEPPTRRERLRLPGVQEVELERGGRRESLSDLGQMQIAQKCRG